MADAGLEDPGPLALVGGDELNPGNEPQDRVLVEAARGGPAYVLATAAARHAPDRSVEHARRWFQELGLTVEPLPATTRRGVRDPENVERARAGRFFYLVGGDPGIVPDILAGTSLWEAVVTSWSRGAALAGSSAGAMAMGSWTLIRDRHPGDDRRRFKPALGLLPGVAVIPHFDTFGQRWVRSALAAAPHPDVVLLGIDERTAAIERNQRWEVLGAGGVTVIRDGRSRRFPSGAILEGLPRPKYP
jgi:cyanophycinase